MLKTAMKKKKLNLQKKTIVTVVVSNGELRWVTVR
jgi:hypothetical protein